MGPGVPTSGPSRNWFHPVTWIVSGIRPRPHPPATTIGGTLSTAAQANVTSLGTLAANLLFVDATYDIGASGATRPRDFFLSRNATIGGTVTSVGLLTVQAGLTVSSGSISAP